MTEGKAHIHVVIERTKYDRFKSLLEKDGKIFAAWLRSEIDKYIAVEEKK